MFLEKSTQVLTYLLAVTSDDKPQYSQRTSQTMATDFATPIQQHFTSSPTHYTLYNSQQSQQISPVDSANATPHNASPTSPRTAAPLHLPAQTRQLRPPKSPMYMPAVLRPTNPPKRAVRNSPLTPPTSTHSSFDDTENARLLRRQSTGDSGRFVLSAIDEAQLSKGLGKVTAVPTREHWKLDHEATVCDAPICTKYFGYFTRRHHCRRCGNIFCDQHSSNSVPLDQDANFHPKGLLVRSCQHCYTEFRRWYELRSSRSNSETTEEPSTPIVNCVRGKAKNALEGVFGRGSQGDGAPASVPRDWNWSTF